MKLKGMLLFAASDPSVAVSVEPGGNFALTKRDPPQKKKNPQAEPAFRPASLPLVWNDQTPSSRCSLHDEMDGGFHRGPLNRSRSVLCVCVREVAGRSDSCETAYN